MGTAASPASSFILSRLNFGGDWPFSKTPLRRKSLPGGSRLRNRGDRITESAKSFEVMIDRALNSFRISGFAELDESRPFAQDIPDDLADSVSDSPDCFDVSETDHKTFE